MWIIRLRLVLLVSFAVLLAAGCGSSGSTSGSSSIGSAVSEIVYTITQDGNNTRAYSVDTATATLHEQPGSPFNLGAVDSGSGDVPTIIGSTPNGAFLLIEKQRPFTGSSSIFVVKADANGIPIFPATDSRDFGQSIESLMGPSGKFVYVHEFDNLTTIRTYELDANGKLTEKGSIELGPNWSVTPTARALEIVTADSGTMIVSQLSFQFKCNHTDFYRVPIDQKTGIPALPTSPVWGADSCLYQSGYFSFSELLAVQWTGVSQSNPPVLPLMNAYPFNGVSYSAGSTCDSAVHSLCRSSTFKVAPHSSFVAIADANGRWHSLDQSLNDTGSTVALPTDACVDFTADGRLMLVIQNQNFVCTGNIHTALFDPAAGTFRPVTGTIPGGGFEHWSSTSVQHNEEAATTGLGSVLRAPALPCIAQQERETRDLLKAKDEHR